MGSGKTVAAKYLESKGFFYINADEVVDLIYQPEGEGYKKIYNFFGDDFLLKSGKLNRRKLAKFVFGDVNKLKILNGLIHPIVTRKIEELLKESSCRYNVVEAVYLDAENLGKIINKVIWIECADNKILKRCEKSGFSDVKMVAKIMSIQREIGIKPQNIDFFIDNNGSRANLYDQLNQLPGVKSG